MKAIVSKKMLSVAVIYPVNYYACDNYLTTDILQKCCKRAGGDYDRFIGEIRDVIEI